MRARLVSLLAAGVVAATAVTGTAAEPRREIQRYNATDDNFIVGGPEEYMVVGTGDSNAQYDFEINKSDKAVSVMVLDDSERPVSGIVTQWEREGGTAAGPASASTYRAVTWQRFCTRTAAPVELKPKLPVRILVMEGTCKDGTPSAPTTGDIVVDFHRS